MIHMPAYFERATLAVALVACAAHAQPRRASTDRFAGLDQVVMDAMETWKVPGLALAVVTRDSVIYAKGYGTRRLGSDAPVNPQTLFAIGSASKAFTGASLAMLSDEGKLTMDDRVIDHLPWFQMYDPWVTREIRLRDLLLHRSGLERGELAWYGTSRSREEVVRTVRYLPPTTSFRTRFQYQNLMYITAGEVVRQKSGMSWDDFVRSRFFEPLGMQGSNTSVRALNGQSNVAQPHAEIAGTIRPIPYRNIDNAGAAGSINSSVMDMSRWVRLWLNGGVAGGKRLLSESMAREAIRPQTTMDDVPLQLMVGNPAFPGYAFGWFVAAFRGKRHVAHGGNIDGMAAMVGFLPDDGVGVVILTNMNRSTVTTPLMSYLFDRALGLTPPDYFGDYRRAEAQFMASMEKPKQPTPAAAPASLPLDAYAGTYRHEMYGTATVRHADGKLTINYDANPNGSGELAHVRHDAFEATMRDPILGKAPVNFRINASAAVEGMTFGLMGADGEWVREKR